MTITNKNLSVVIVSFYSQEVIHNCINSIPEDIKIIVIENSGSLDFKIDLERKYKNVKCILSFKNLGMGAGNNLGLSKVETDYAFILNPDVVLEKNTIEEIIFASEKLGTFGLVSPLSKNKEYPNYTIDKKGNSLIDNNAPFKVKSVDGFAMLLNLKILKKLEDFKDNKFFDENFFLYLENDDLCKRIDNNNKNIFIIPKSKINHLGASGVAKNYKDQIELSRNWHWIWSKFYFNKKHNGFLIATMIGLPIFVSAILKFSFYSLLKSKKRHIYFQRASGFYNALLGKKSFFRPKIKN